MAFVSKVCDQKGTISWNMTCPLGKMCAEQTVSSYLYDTYDQDEKRRLFEDHVVMRTEEDLESKI